MKGQRIFFFTVLIAALVGVVLMLLARDPRYQGRSLTRWLQQYYYTGMDQPQRRQEAQQAVLAMPLHKVLPRLLRMVQVTDDPVSLWLIDKTDKYRIRFIRWISSEQYSYEDWHRIRWRSAEDFQQLGIAGFEILGTNAAPAVGELEKLLDVKDRNFDIERCLVSVGKPSEPVYCRALTNQDAEIRQWGINELASVTDDVEVYIARIKGRLQDSSEAVRTTAVDAVGVQTSAPELAIPLLVAALTDSSDSVSSHAASSLANFGTNALGCFLKLSNLVENGGTNTAGAALKSIVVIAPNESLSILTNCIARGYPGINEALKSLQEVAPEKALPIILNRFQSPDLTTRSAAFWQLCRYPITPPIESALQTAANDSEFTIAHRAKEILTEQYREVHPIESQFTNEPVFQGKGLGEWLKTRRSPDGSFPNDAMEAIRQMGTNAIPALLARLVYEEPPYGVRSPVGGTVNTEAMCAFIILGEEAIPALPQLRLLMDGTNGDIALRAMMATCGTGSNVTPFFISGLTNQFADVRNEAANYISQNFTNQFLGQRDQLAPLFVTLLDDPDEFVRGNATNELKQIAPIAAAKAGIK